MFCYQVLKENSQLRMLHPPKLSFSSEEEMTFSGHRELEEAVAAQYTCEEWQSKFLKQRK